MVGIARVFPGKPPTVALSEVDMTVAAGEFLSILGPSGSGKSTLLQIIGLLDKPTGGHYRFDGTDLASVSDRYRTMLRGSSIGFVFQAFHLLGQRSALENVALTGIYSGKRRRDRLRAAEGALISVGLEHRIHAAPSTMSGGERQRVAIARAICGAPRLLLCDEPTGNLDSVNADGVLKLLEGLRQLGLTIVMITHDASVAQRADRELIILDGRTKAESAGE